MIKIISAPTNLTTHKNDIKILMKLSYNASFRDICIPESFFDEKFDALQNYLNNKQCQLLLAKNTTDNHIIGLCHFFIKNDFNQTIAHLNQIAVLEEFQGKRFECINKNGGGRHYVK